MSWSSGQAYFLPLGCLGVELPRKESVSNYVPSQFGHNPNSLGPAVGKKNQTSAAPPPHQGPGFSSALVYRSPGLKVGEAFQVQTMELLPSVP